MAEQEFRFAKVKQKISGSFRKAFGIKDIAVLRSSIGTARKRGWSALRAL